MPRGEKGILGYRKDPKKQILFSFTARQGDDWPSDDSDEDYKPEGDHADSESVAKKRNEKRKPNSRAQKNGKQLKNSSDQPSPKRLKKTSKRISNGIEKKNFIGHKDDLWGSFIPPEVLHKIFETVVESDGSLPFLIRAFGEPSKVEGGGLTLSTIIVKKIFLRAQRVNRLWREVASDDTLWTKVDLSFGWVKKVPNMLLRLCDSRLGKVRDLNLTGWQKLNGDSLKVIGAKCTRLRSLNLTQCKKVTASSLHDLIDSCPSLTALHLSDVSSDVHNTKSLNTILEKCGKKMKELSLSQNRVSGFNASVKKIYETCASLEVLDLSHMIFSSDFLSLDILRLQRGCPLLRVLNLNASAIRPAPVRSGQSEHSIHLNLELGHRVLPRSSQTEGGYTHDWVCFVRGPGGHNIAPCIEKVIFTLHQSDPNPNRVFKEPPYEVSGPGYASFNMDIIIHFRNESEPKTRSFVYDINLNTEAHVRCETLTFQYPMENFRRLLFESGGHHGGFARLEELHIASQGPAVNRNENLLKTILWNSTKLRVLDIRNNTGAWIGTDHLQSVPLQSLQYLYASRCGIVKEGRFRIILEKCRDTLQELHIEWASQFESQNENALKQLAKPRAQKSPLRVLNLTGNALTSMSVRAVLDGCAALETLDLTSCRGLPRGVKRLYSGKKQLRKLKEALKDSSDTDICTGSESSDSGSESDD